MVNYGTSALDFLDIRHDAADSIDVDTLSLDELEIPPGSNIAIKVDVEGHEEHALLGATETIRKANSVVLMIEIFDRNLERVSKTLDSLQLELLRQVGPENYLYTRSKPPA